MYCGKYARITRGEEDAFLYLAMNMYWEPGKLAMPKLPKGLKWELKYCTDEVACEGQIPGRSCAVYISVPDEDYAKTAAKSSRGKKTVAATEVYSDRTMF